MRKIIVISMISLDGVMQAPGGPEEDNSDGFELGGWTADYSDEISGEVMQHQMEASDILLGRKTFQIFESYWPTHADNWPGINDVKKYVLSNTLHKFNWSNVVHLKSLDEIEQLKNSEGGDIKVWGSSQLVHSLLQNNLVDKLWLNIFPVILGKGKKLFDNSSVPAAFKITESVITPKGVVMASYELDGKIQTGTVGE
ncbi:MAG: dihydrofolate reductase family protein [Patescibacteria group bacterium]